MKKEIATAAMAALVVIAGITGASSAAHAAVFFAPAGSDFEISLISLILISPIILVHRPIAILRSSRSSSNVVIYAADKWLLSPLVQLFVFYARTIIIVHRRSYDMM